MRSSRRFKKFIDAPLYMDRIHNGYKLIDILDPRGNKNYFQIWNIYKCSAEPEIYDNKYKAIQAALNSPMIY